MADMLTGVGYSIPMRGRVGLSLILGAALLLAVAIIVVFKIPLPELATSY